MYLIQYDLNESRKFLVCLPQVTQVNPSEPKWIKVNQSEPQLPQVNPNETKWTQVYQSEPM